MAVAGPSWVVTLARLKGTSCGSTGTMQTLILVTLCLGAVYGGVPKSSYTRTEEGQKVAIPGLETTTTTIDNIIGEVFGETTLAQDNGASSTTVITSSASTSGEESTTEKKSTTTEKQKVQTTSSTTQKPSTEEKADATSTPASSAPGGGSFGFNVAFPTLPPLDKIKIPNPLGGLFSG